VYDSDQLMNRWERMAQEEAEHNRQEKERKEKSALNGLFKKWAVDLAVRSGAPSSKTDHMSDFRKIVVEAVELDLDMSKYEESLNEAKIRVAPPPRPKPKPTPPSPPPVRRPAPPPQPRKERAPKPVEKKPEKPKMPPPKKPEPPKPAMKHVEKPKHEPLKIEKIEPIKLPQPAVGWGESWQMVKSPRLQTGQGSTTAKQTNDKMYKALGYELEKKWGSPAETWKESWKQLKIMSEPASTKDMSFFEIMSEGKWWRTFEEVDTVSLPVWADANKTFTVVFEQTKEEWNQEWPQYNHERRDKVELTLPMEDRNYQPGWEGSWKSSKVEPKKEEVMSELKIPTVFLPGWMESWKTTDKHVQHGNGSSQPSMKDWRNSWSYCQEQKWWSASTKSRYHHYAMMMSKRKQSNELRSCLIEEGIPSEWMESWKSPKPKVQPQSEKPKEPVSDMSDVPLHLQFHKTNIPSSTWRESWRMCCAHGAGEEQSSSPKWKNSWKLSSPPVGVPTQEHKDVLCFSTKHKTHRYMGVKHAEDAMLQNEWSESWQITKPSPQPQGDKNVSDSKYNLSKQLLPVVSPLQWSESWRFTPVPSPPSSYSLARWSESWKLSNPNQSETNSFRQNGPKHHRYLQELELPGPEWPNSWKYFKSDKLDPNMAREDSDEWGQCWKVLNPQLYKKKEAWCDQVSTEDSKDVGLLLSFLSKEDKTILDLDLSSSEWTESWRLPKQEH